MPGKVADFFEPSAFGGDILVVAVDDSILSLRLRSEEKLIWVMELHGKGMRWYWDLKRFALSNGYEWLGFKIAEPNAKRSAFIRYTKAQLMASTPSGDEYCVSLRAR